MFSALGIEGAHHKILAQDVTLTAKAARNLLGQLH
jgi:hypothetical protein